MMEPNYPEKAKQKRRLPFVSDTEATRTAAANIAVRDVMVANGRGSKRIADEMELVEQELEAVAEAMRRCQPAGGYDLLAVRWWRRGAAAGGTLRTPVLVRMERYGRHIRPVQIRSAAVRARQDGAFGLNYDLVDRLVPLYWRGYRVWKGLSLE